jgi:hypothetical protein
LEDLPLNDLQPTPQPTPTNEPANGGQLALLAERDALWRETRNPKIGLFAMTAIYRRMAELRAEIARLENQP